MIASQLSRLQLFIHSRTLSGNDITLLFSAKVAVARGRDRAAFLAVLAAEADISRCRSHAARNLSAPSMTPLCPGSAARNADPPPPPPPLVTWSRSFRTLRRMVSTEEPGYQSMSCGQGTLKPNTLE